MSFILDALKKSEAERRRQAEPTLLDVPLAKTRPRVPWGWLVIGALLGVNLLILMWLGWRGAQAPAPLATVRAGVATPTPAGVPPATTAGAAPAAVAPATRSSAATAPVPADSAAAESSDNPADLLDATAPPGGTVQHSLTPQSLPRYQEVNGALPDLHLDLNVYAPRPADRYALINLHKVREGDRLPEGASVVEITPGGVILSYRGSQFLLGQE